MIVVEHAHERRRQRMRFGRGGRNVGPRRSACRRNIHARKVGRVAGAERRLGHVQRELRPVRLQRGGILVTHLDEALSPESRTRQLARVDLRKRREARALDMSDDTASTDLPDRLSLDPRSPHFDEDVLKRGRRHPFQRKREDERRGILRVGRLDPRVGGQEPRSLRQPDDHLAQGQGRALRRAEARNRFVRRSRRRRVRRIVRIAALLALCPTSSSLPSLHRAPATTETDRAGRLRQRLRPTARLEGRDSGLRPSLR